MNAHARIVRARRALVTIAFCAAHVFARLTQCAAAAPPDSAAAGAAPAAPADSVAALAAPDTLGTARDSMPSAEPPDEAQPGADYELERDQGLGAGEIEVGYSIASRSGGRAIQRRRVAMREAGVEAEVREGRGDALAGAALGARVPGGWLALGRAAPRWGRALVIGTPHEPWRARGFDAAENAQRARAGDAIEFRRAGALAVDLVAAHASGTRLAAARLGLGAAALELAIARGGVDRRVRPLAGLALTAARSEAELGLGAHGTWRLEAVHATSSRGVSLGMRLGHFDYSGASPLRVAPPSAALTAALRTAPRRALQALAEGALWRSPGGQTGHRAALEVTADMAQHEAIQMGLEERRGVRRAAAEPADGALRQGLWAEWRRGFPGVSMNLRHEWWGQSGGLARPVRELARAELEARARSSFAASLTVWLYRSWAGEPQYLADSEVDRNIWRAVSGAGRRTRLRLSLPAAGGSVRASLTVTQSGGSAPPPQWTLDWSRRNRTRG